LGSCNSNFTDADDDFNNFGSTQSYCAFELPACDGVPTSEPTLASGSSSNDDDELTDGAVAGIVIAVLIGVGVLGYAAYYYFYIRSAGGDTTKSLMSHNVL
jgi:hypothetical protein